jgi:hypothetical protein
MESAATKTGDQPDAVAPQYRDQLDVSSGYSLIMTSCSAPAG